MNFNERRFFIVSYSDDFVDAVEAYLINKLGVSSEKIFDGEEMDEKAIQSDYPHMIDILILPDKIKPNETLRVQHIVNLETDNLIPKNFSNLDKKVTELKALIAA